MKSDVIIVEGAVIENLPNTLFRVQLNDSDKIILCYLSGKMRKNPPHSSVTKWHAPVSTF